MTLYFFRMQVVVWTFCPPFYCTHSAKKFFARLQTASDVKVPNVLRRSRSPTRYEPLVGFFLSFGDPEAFHGNNKKLQGSSMRRFLLRDGGIRCTRELAFAISAVNSHAQICSTIYGLFL